MSVDMPGSDTHEQAEPLGQAHRGPLTFFDLFAGCGGLSLGLLKAGWQGLLGVEADPFAFETLKANLIDGAHGYRYEWPAWFPKEPCQVATFQRRYKRQLAELNGRVDLIAGGPPCQGFSLAGLRKRDDHRNAMFRHYVAIVELIQPRFLLLENVRGIEVEFDKKKRTRTNKKKVGRPAKPFSQRIRENLEKAGYRVFAGRICAVDFGVPQLRPRFIMFGIQQSLFESGSTRDPFEVATSIRESFLKTIGLPVDRPVSVREAISDLETANASLVECVDSPGSKQMVYQHPVTGFQRILHAGMDGRAPNSLRLANHQERTKERFSNILETCRHGVQLNTADRARFGLSKKCTVPLDGDKPSHTLTTLPDDLLHYSEPRILTVREYARLQSFPDWYEFRGAYTTGGDRRIRQVPRYSQVGNAVPPFLGEVFGDVLSTLDADLSAAQRPPVP